MRGAVWTREYRLGRRLLQNLSLRIDLSASKSNDYQYRVNSDPEYEQTLGVVTVHAPGEIQNKDLRPTINRKIEGGFSLETPAVNLDATFFYERQTGGFGSAT